MNFAAIIAAGGIGKRFGKEEGKQLFFYKEKPIVIHTIEKFLGKVDQIIVVINENDIKKLKEELKKYSIVISEIVSGGKYRYDSVRNGLAKVREDIDHVLIHDGARPNVSEQVIENVKKGLKENSAVIPVIPVKDTIKRVDDNKVLATLKRDELFVVQTPQGFNKDLLLGCYKKVDISGCTDDAMVCERCGEDVFVVPGDQNNIKVTTFSDISLLE